MEAARLAPIVEGDRRRLRLSVDRRVRLPAAVSEAGVSADLGISGAGEAALVFEKTDRPFRNAWPAGETAIVLQSAADLPEAIGTLLRRFGIPAIGPTVEFYRAPAPGSARRFVISVPGWLAETGGRRLLITGSAPPPLVRLYLTREGIDVFEYRVRDGR